MKAPAALLVPIISSAALLLAAPVASSATPANANPRLETAAFTSPQQGYGLFTASTGSAKICRLDVARTTDGGRHFSRLASAASWPCDNNPPVSSIAADTSGDVFAYGPALRVSHDHGRSWTIANLKGHVLAITASGRSIWAVTTSCTRTGSTFDKCQVLLMVSANGGGSWHLASDQPAGATTSGFGQNPASNAALTRTSAQHAYLLVSSVLSAHSQPVLWTTTNGGSSWRRHFVSCHRSSSAALAVAPGGKIFVACAGEPTAGFQSKTIVTSANGGRSWNSRASCDSTSCGPLLDGYLNQIAAVSDHTVFLTGIRSPLMISHHDGARWHIYRPEIGDAGGGAYQVSFFGSRGIVIGSDPANNEIPAIWHSTDGGATWQVIHPVIP